MASWHTLHGSLGAHAAQRWPPAWFPSVWLLLALVLAATLAVLGVGCSGVAALGGLLVLAGSGLREVLASCWALAPGAGTELASGLPAALSEPAGTAAAPESVQAEAPGAAVPGGVGRTRRRGRASRRVRAVGRLGGW